MRKQYILSAVLAAFIATTAAASAEAYDGHWHGGAGHPGYYGHGGGYWHSGYGYHRYWHGPVVGGAPYAYYPAAYPVAYSSAYIAAPDVSVGFNFR